MNTDIELEHSASSSKLLFEAETKRILACAFDVLNEIGHGLNEKVYENGLCVAFALCEIGFEQQRQFPVYFRNHLVGNFIPDLIVFENVVVDTKVIDRISDHERGQMLNYLRLCKLRVGLILNFKRARLEWERLVL